MMQDGLSAGSIHASRLALALACFVLVALPSLFAAAESAKNRATAAPKHYTLDERLAEIRTVARARLKARFKSAGASWPPSSVTLLALKDEKVLELHARTRSGPWRLVHRYPVLAASGGPGPKLREGDRQVPEGIYRVIFLNANSRYHVSLRLDYPNALDQDMGARDGRTALGGDIMIHGNAVSIGCLAMGDPAAEELFVLAASVSLLRQTVIIAPTDFRYPSRTAVLGGDLPWLPWLYGDIAREMAAFRGNLDGLVSAAGHWQRCDIPHRESRRRLHRAVLAGNTGAGEHAWPCERIVGHTAPWRSSNGEGQGSTAPTARP